MKRYALVTGNVHKWTEARRLLGDELERLELDVTEVQAPTVRDVALHKVKAAYQAAGRPVIVEDAGLEFLALGGFPGPFIKYWEQLGGLESMCRALDGRGDRRAAAVCVLAYADGDGAGLVEGRVDGRIAEAPRGRNGFGWDAVFCPEDEDRTFGEMSAAEKDARSHRARAWRQLRLRLASG